MPSRFVLPFADVGQGIIPSDGAKLFFFATGTSTPKDTFSDSAGTIPNANPVIADASGVFSDIFISGSYKVQLKDKNDVQLWEADPVDENNVRPLLDNDKRYGPIFSTVAAMTAVNPVSIDGESVNLVSGMRVTIQGYTTAGDGGGKSGLIKPNQVVDGFGDHLNGNGTVFIMDRDDVIDVRQFGVDNITDDTAALQAAADATDVAELILPAAMKLNATVKIPAGVGMGRASGMCKITLDEAGTFTNGWVFFINSTDGIDWDVTFPNIVGGKIHNLNFRNEGGTQVRRGILAFVACDIANLRGFNMTQMVKRPANAATGVYLDNFAVRRVYGEPVLGTDYQIELAGQGDSNVVEECHFPWNALNPGDGTVNAYKASGGLAIDFRNNIGGNTLLSNGVFASVTGCHLERTQLVVDASNANISRTYFGAGAKVPILCTDNAAHDYALNLNDCEFTYVEGGIAFTGADIQLDNRFTLSVTNCHRRFTVTGGLDKSQLMGIKVDNNTATDITDWSDFSYTLSKRGVINRNFNVVKDFTVTEVATGFPGVTGSLDSGLTWGGATNTYFYSTQNFTDINRLYGRNQTNAEVSQALTNGGNAIRLDVDYGSKNNSGIVRVYRGTTTNSYDFFADIPAYSLGRIWDTGTEINGVPWVARTPGAKDTINSNGVESVKYSGTKAEAMAVSPPTVGTHSIGDRVYDMTPVASIGFVGWVATAGGTPGTWKTFGPISA